MKDIHLDIDALNKRMEALIDRTKMAMAVFCGDRIEIAFVEMITVRIDIFLFYSFDLQNHCFF